MAKVTGDDVFSIRGEGAIEDLVVVGIGAGGAGLGGLESVGDFDD